MDNEIRNNVTMLDQLDNDYIDLEVTPESTTPICNVAMDFTLSLFHRVNALNKMTTDEQYELVKRLMMMMRLSETKTVKEYLVYIIQHSFVSSSVKIDGCLHIIEEDEEGYELLDNVLFDITVGDYIGSDVRKECVLDAIVKLSESIDHSQQVFDHLVRFINDTTIEISYRYSSILSLKNEKNINHIELCRVFFDNTDNFITYRIMAGQNLLSLIKDDRADIQDVLLSFANDVELDENVRADAADVILDLGDPEYVLRAGEIIIALGRTNGPSTVYNDKQNVHNSEINASTMKAILKILEKKPGNSFEKVCERVIEAHDNLYRDMPHNDNYLLGVEKIEFSLKRIELDRKNYYGNTLVDIVRSLYEIIVDSDHYEELMNRMVEELIDMSNTCSSGHASRMVSVLSGFDSDISISISYEDQLLANLHGRLQARVKLIKDPEYQGDVLIEMLSSGSGESRKNFLRFFRENISDIREQLWKEFCDNEVDGRLMEDTDFDMMFHKAVIHFTTGERYI